MRKMSIVFHRVDGGRGMSYECFYCKTALHIEEADYHECIPMHEGHDARVDDYIDSLTVECFTCEIIFSVDKDN